MATRRHKSALIQLWRLEMQGATPWMSPMSLLGLIRRRWVRERPDGSLEITPLGYAELAHPGHQKLLTELHLIDGVVHRICP